MIPLGLTAEASTADAGINKKILGSDRRHSSSLALPKNTTLVISNEKMKDIIEIVKSPEESGLFLKGVSKTIQSEAKEQKGGFLSMLLGTLGARLLGNIVAGKGINRAGEGTVRATKRFGKEQKKQKEFLIPPHPLTNLKYKNIIKMNQDLMVFILEII